MGDTSGTKRRVATHLSAIRLAIACGAVSVAVSAQAVPVTLQIGSVQGLAGQTVSVDVTIDNVQSAAGVESDIVFTAQRRLPPRPSTSPSARSMP